VQSNDSSAEFADEGLFVRKSSGLVRELGIREAFALNMSGVNLAGGIGFFFFVILAGFPGTDLTWPIVISLVGALLLSAAYSQLAATMPRSGADFVYLSRVFHPGIGAAAGIALVSFLLLNLAVNAVELANTYIPSVFQTLGSVLHSTGLKTFSSDLAGKGQSMVVAAIVLAGVAALMTRHVGIIARSMFAGFVISFVATVAIILEFLLHGHGAFVHAFNSHVGDTHGYSRLIAAARHAGATTGVHWSEVISSLALVFGLYLGATYANINGGELRRAGRTFRASTFLSLGVSFVLVLLAWLTLRGMAGLSFLQSSAFLSANDPTHYAKLAGDVTAYVPSYVLVVAGDPVTKILVSVGFAVGQLMIVVVCALAASRLLFALAFDRVLPTKVADVRAKSHIPVVAIAIVSVVGAGLTFLTIETTVLTATRNSYLMVSAVFALSSIAAAVIPWRRRDLYERSPKMFGNRILGVPAVTWLGGLSAIFWIYATYAGATKTQVSGGYSTSSVIVLAVMSLGGAVCYAVSRHNMRARGLDLSLAMHELPPE
jgi:amino acid transporter